MRLTSALLVLLALALPTQALAEGARYLIICPENYEEALEPLVEWKNRKGLLTKVVTTSETGYSSSQIESYIADAVETWNPAPEFVLLAGYSSDIPMGYNGGASGDTGYGSIDGDMIIEIHPGRFPATNVTEIELMVEKTIQYERYPTTDPGYYRSAAICISEDHDDDDWLHYFGDAYWIEGLLTGSDYDSVNILSVATTQNNAQTLTGYIEDGLSLATFHGVIGGTIGWAGFNIYPDQIQNGPMLPVIVSYTCQTCGYDDAGGEQWMRAGSPGDLRGGVAFVGQTQSCSYCADWRSALRRGWYGYVFEDTSETDIVTFGAAVEAGRVKMYNEVHQEGQYYASLLYGDPSLNLWTKLPEPIEISHPPVVPRGNTSFTVRVTKESLVREGVQVCVMSDEGSHQWGISNGDGEVEFDLDTTDDSVLYITATGRNLQPYEAEIDVGGEPEEEPAQDDDDDDDNVDDDDDDDTDDDDAFTEPIETEGDLEGTCACSQAASPRIGGAALLSLLAFVALLRRRFYR